MDSEKRKHTLTRQVVEAIRMAIAREIKDNGEDSPKVPELRELFQIAVHDDRLYRLVSAAPPATAEQRRRIALLLQPKVNQ